MSNHFITAMATGSVLTPFDTYSTGLCCHHMHMVCCYWPTYFGLLPHSDPIISENVLLLKEIGPSDVELGCVVWTLDQPFHLSVFIKKTVSNMKYSSSKHHISLNKNSFPVFLSKTKYYSWPNYTLGATFLTFLLNKKQNPGLACQSHQSCDNHELLFSTYCTPVALKDS